MQDLFSAPLGLVKFLVFFLFFFVSLCTDYSLLPDNVKKARTKGKSSRGESTNHLWLVIVHVRLRFCEAFCYFSFRSATPV